MLALPGSSAMVWVTPSGVGTSSGTRSRRWLISKGAPMPLNAGFKYFETNFLRPAYNEKKVPIQVHTAVTAFIMSAHRSAREEGAPEGDVGAPLARPAPSDRHPRCAVQLRHAGAPPAENTRRYAEHPLIFFILYYAIKGWLEIRNKQTQAHRSSMIMLSSCFFFFAVQRLVMLPFGCI